MYNHNEYPSYMYTAGKITIVTSLLGGLVLAFVFLFNVGQKEFQTAQAQSLATTSVTVLNTPPQWDVLAYELVESSTSTPTNSGDQVQWTGTATDSNNEPYWLLICSSSATPTPGTSTSTPTCDAADTRWAVSATTSSGVAATAATTTTESAPFSEREAWTAWVCDAIDLNPRCNSTFSQGLAATNSSPFHVNSRPVFTGFTDDSPADPGAVVNFNATSSDSDVIGGADDLYLIVCGVAGITAGSNATSTVCTTATSTLATSTLVTSNPTAAYTVVIPTQDQDYNAFGYIVDEHGHLASGGAQGTDSTLSVNNVAPTVSGASIQINNGADMTLSVHEGETTGFTLQYTATDDNSCENASSGEEITGHVLSLYRSGIGSTTCDGATGTYNANNCYPSGIGSAVWNLSCTATTTLNDCNYSNDGIDRTRIFTCTFPLWFVADPTDGGATNTPNFAQNWLSEVAAVDDDNATGTSAEATTGQEVISFLGFDVPDNTIPYGELEPGDDTGTLTASTTMRATGNVGLDEGLIGESMCTTYTSTSTCPNSATSTIAENNQEFATAQLAYGAGTALSSSTQQELELNIPKTTSTSSPNTAETYWGIGVPGTITLAGLYTGENTIVGIISEPGDW